MNEPEEFEKGQKDGHKHSFLNVSEVISYLNCETKSTERLFVE